MRPCTYQAGRALGLRGGRGGAHLQVGPCRLRLSGLTPAVAFLRVSAPLPRGQCAALVRRLGVRDCTWSRLPPESCEVPCGFGDSGPCVCAPCSARCVQRPGVQRASTARPGGLSCKGGICCGLRGPEDPGPGSPHSSASEGNPWTGRVSAGPLRKSAPHASKPLPACRVEGRGGHRRAPREHARSAPAVTGPPVSPLGI